MIDRFAHLILAVQWNFIKAITILSGSILRHTGTFTNQVQILQDVRITRIALIQGLGIIQISLAQTVKRYPDDTDVYRYAGFDPMRLSYGSDNRFAERHA